MFDGQAEAAAILIHLATVGTVLEDMPDDADIPVDWSGAPTPYMVVNFNGPTPAARGRGLGVDEQGQPQVLAFTVTYLGPTKSDVRNLRSAGDTALVGWTPVAANATEIKVAGGSPLPSLATENKPTISRHIRFYTLGINATVDRLA